MDQLYSNAKAAFYRNRKLFRARLHINPNCSLPLTFADIGFIFFCGDVALVDGTFVTFQASVSLIWIHLQAREKWLPSSTRNALNPVRRGRKLSGATTRSCNSGLIASRGSDSDSDSDSDNGDTEEIDFKPIVLVVCTTSLKSS
jgi:hypothetical protein